MAELTKNERAPLPPAPPPAPAPLTTPAASRRRPVSRQIKRPPARRREPLTHEARVLVMALAAGAPAVLVSLALLWAGDYTPKVFWTLLTLILCFWLGFSFAVRGRVVRPLQTVSNLLAALREGDYSFRARGGRGDDALSEVIREINALGETMREHEASHTLTKAFPGDGGVLRRWGVRRSSFRERGVAHQLLVVADLSRPLREEELKAWQRIVRVLGHELNNSLARIKSIAGSLASLLAREPLPADWRDDARRGLEVVSARAESLSRFTESYARLARLPPPRLAPVEVGRLVRRVAGLETRLRVEVVAGAGQTVSADADQLEQLLINLVRNAADASLVTNGAVRMGWRGSNGHVEIWVQDEGLGLASTANLFVPFFTTKPGGSGIGLVLSRQIAEAHGGTLTLENRAGARGCEARLRLPA